MVKPANSFIGINKCKAKKVLLKMDNFFDAGDVDESRKVRDEGCALKGAGLDMLDWMQESERDLGWTRLLGPSSWHCLLIDSPGVRYYARRNCVIKVEANGRP